MSVMILNPERHWLCPSCSMPHVTKQPVNTQPMHNCRALNGLSVPFVEAHDKQELGRNKHQHRLLDREDYVNGEMVRTDGNGRPVMAVHTDHADRPTDVAVYAPCATAFGEA